MKNDLNISQKEFINTWGNDIKQELIELAYKRNGILINDVQLHFYNSPIEVLHHPKSVMDALQYLLFFLESLPIQAKMETYRV